MRNTRHTHIALLSVVDGLVLAMLATKDVHYRSLVTGHRLTAHRSPDRCLDIFTDEESMVRLVSQVTLVVSIQVAGCSTQPG
jgi:hypothetical protein